MEEKEFDPVLRPVGYNQGGIEVVDYHMAKLTTEEFRGHCKAAAIEYLSREKFKNGTEDVRKAHWWIQMLLFVDGAGPDPRAYRLGVPDHE